MLCLWFFRFVFRPAIKTGNAGFNFFQQFVVGDDLSVYFPLVGADTALFHLAGSWPQMDRGNFINALPLVAAVVNTLRSTGRFQCPVGVGCPRCPPNLHISFIVPVGRILPMIFPAAYRRFVLGFFKPPLAVSLSPPPSAPPSLSSPHRCWGGGRRGGGDRKSTRLNSSHITRSRMPSSA